MLTIQIINDLKDKKVRITKARKALLTIFESSTKPESVLNILSRLSKKGVKVNKTTVYRELSFLLKQGLIKEVYTDPTKIQYESSYLDHHHHLICTGCGMVDDVEMENELKYTEDKILKTKRFKVIDHSLEFYGFCANCQKK